MSLLFCTITVPSTVEVPDPQEPDKTFTSYNITCVHNASGKSQSCTRRFHEFREFDRVWTSLYPTIAERIKLPSTFAPIQTKGVIDKRRGKLQDYLVGLAEIKAIQPLLAQFIGVPEDYVCAPRGPRQENLPDIAIDKWRGMEDAKGKIHGLGREQQNANDTQTHGLVSVEKDGETFFIPGQHMKKNVDIDDAKVKGNMQRGNTHDASERAKKEKEEFLKKNAGIIASLMPGRQMNFAYNVDRAGQTNDRYMGRVHVSLWFRQGTGGKQRPTIQDGFEDVGGGCLVLEIHSGMDLPSYDGITNPYCKMHLLPDPKKISKKKTSSKQRTVNPTWEEVIEYNGIYPAELQFHRLSISIWDRRTTGKNNCVGEVMVKDLMNLPTHPSQKLSRWIELGPWSNLSINDANAVSVNQLASGSVNETVTNKAGAGNQTWAAPTGFTTASGQTSPTPSPAPAAKPIMPSKPPPKLKPTPGASIPTPPAPTPSPTLVQAPTPTPIVPPQPAATPLPSLPQNPTQNPTPTRPAAGGDLAAALAARAAQTQAQQSQQQEKPTPTPPPQTPVVSAPPPRPQPTPQPTPAISSPPPRPQPTPQPTTTSSTPNRVGGGPDLAALLAARNANASAQSTTTSSPQASSPPPAPKPNVTPTLTLAPTPKPTPPKPNPIAVTPPAQPISSSTINTTSSAPSRPDLSAVLAARNNPSQPTPASAPAPAPKPLVAPLPPRPISSQPSQTSTVPPKPPGPPVITSQGSTSSTPTPPVAPKPNFGGFTPASPTPSPPKPAFASANNFLPSNQSASTSTPTPSNAPKPAFGGGGSAPPPNTAVAAPAVPPIAQKPNQFSSAAAFAKPSVPSTPSQPTSTPVPASGGATSAPPIVPKRNINLAIETNVPAMTPVPTTAAIAAVRSPVADQQVPVVAARPPPAPQPSHRFVVILDYNPTADDIASNGLLPLKINDVVNVIDRSDEVGWWYGSVGAKEGYFPGTYVKQA